MTTETHTNHPAETLESLLNAYREVAEKGLALNMSRGKPAKEQLDLSQALLGSLDTHITADGTDARNYGILDGIPECRQLFADLLHLDADHIIIGGSSSLNMMFDTMASLCLFGTGGNKPWQYYQYEGTPVKFLCPVPGYDRHFRVCEELGIEMIPIPLLEDGPDMDIVQSLAGNDPLIKGIWCVPLHSNPAGICYSDQIVDRLASMETAADDFRIFWDNAYGVHHIYQEVKLKNILDACAQYDHPDRAYYFFSTSKITFPGSGIALISSGSGNIKELKKHMSAQTIGHDKINQLRHVAYFQNPDRIKDHMKDLADALRPKFDMVLDKLDKGLAGTGLATWSHPLGGYFVSLNTLPGCAKRTIELAKGAGVVLTEAGAAYPYHNDPEDTNIRIAPSYPSLDELDEAMDIFILCIKIAGMEKMKKEQ